MAIPNRTGEIRRTNTLSKNNNAFPGYAPPKKASELSGIPTLLPEVGEELCLPRGHAVTACGGLTAPLSIHHQRDNPKSRTEALLLKLNYSGASKRSSALLRKSTPWINLFPRHDESHRRGCPVSEMQEWDPSTVLLRRLANMMCSRGRGRARRGRRAWAGSYLRSHGERHKAKKPHERRVAPTPAGCFRRDAPTCCCRRVLAAAGMPTFQRE